MKGGGGRRAQRRRGMKGGAQRGREMRGTKGERKKKKGVIMKHTLIGCLMLCPVVSPCMACM